MMTGTQVYFFVFLFLHTYLYRNKDKKEGRKNEDSGYKQKILQDIVSEHIFLS